MNIEFLHGIAAISTSYVGFTSIFIALRDVGSKRVDNFTNWSTRYLVAVALTTVGTALLPEVLTNLIGDEPISIRVSSIFAAILLGRLDAIYILRRPHVDTHRLDWRLKTLLIVAILIDLMFGVIAIGLISYRASALYLALELGEVLVMFCYFAWTLERLLPLRWETGSP